MNKLVIEFEELPNNCKECPFYIDEYDEDALWGDGHTPYCVFGASYWGCHIERPNCCPIGSTILIPRRQPLDQNGNYNWS